MEVMVPKQITAPMGVHSGFELMIIGMTPIEAAAEVRNIGRILRFPASKAASITLMLCFVLQFLGIIKHDDPVPD